LFGIPERQESKTCSCSLAEAACPVHCGTGIKICQGSGDGGACYAGEECTAASTCENGEWSEMTVWVNKLGK
jgi:hypothetical protein